MRIVVTGPNTFSGDDLQTGCEYDCIPAEDGTDKQNRTFHALLHCYWVSGQHSYDVRNIQHFKELIKLTLGAGVERYYSLIDDNGLPLKSPVVRWRVKSWSNYTKKERKEAIDRLIADMKMAGVNSIKFEEILRSIEDGKKE